jgi:hypothetical protein
MANLREQLAASALIVTCEKICKSGVLPEREELILRVLIVDACKAFEISPAWECEVIPFPGNGVYLA